MQRVDKNKVTEYIKTSRGKFVLGIDGIKDEVWQTVETRLSKDECKIFDSVRAYGEYILNRGEGGMAVERLLKRAGFGGFTGNTGYALGTMGYKPTLLGMYGANQTDAVFEPLAKLCSLISVGNPVVCHVMEFTDGKIMMPYLSELLNFNWGTLLSVLSVEELCALFQDADIVAFGYWSNLYAFDELIVNMYKHLLSNNKTKRVFHDFANIKKRSEDALKTSLKLMASLDSEIPMTLSLNEHEAALLFEYYGRNYSIVLEELLTGLVSLRKQIGIDELIVHTPNFAAGASAGGERALLTQIPCAKPVRTAGAGDTFNAGYIAASLGGINLCERLAIANAATLFFVTNGFPPGKENLCEYINRAEHISEVD